MSGYPPDQPEFPGPPTPREFEDARSAVRIPGILLLVVGLLSLVGSVLGAVQLKDVPAQMDEAIADIDADPQIPQDQKDMWRKVLTAVKEAAENPAAVYGYVAGAVASLVVLVGGWKLLTLSGTGLPVAGSVLAMIPCTVGCCCLLGLPAGIWALVVLNRPSVRAVIAARRNPPADPDAQYMR